MPDETKTNLEPIEENDLELKNKFIGGNSPENVEKKTPEAGVETVTLPEQEAEKIERKEGMMEKESAYAKILSKVTAQASPQDDQIANDADLASQESDIQSKITNLVNLAETKGIPHAVKVARHLEDNYVLDELHDRLLSEELHDALIKKGLIKEV